VEKAIAEAAQKEEKAVQKQEAAKEEQLFGAQIAKMKFTTSEEMLDKMLAMQAET